MMLAMSVMTLILWILHEWMEQMNIPWMNGTNEYSVNEWNEWIFREWMEQMNIPWMNGANEYSLNEWNEWIFREWMERMNIPWMNGTNEYSVSEYSSSRAGRVKCKQKTFYDFYYERFEFLPNSSPHTLSLSLSLGFARSSRK